MPVIEVEERRLAGTVRADHADDLALVDVQVEVGDDPEAAEVHRHRPEVEQALCARLAPISTRARPGCRSASAPRSSTYCYVPHGESSRRRQMFDMSSDPSCSWNGIGGIPDDPAAWVELSEREVGMVWGQVLAKDGFLPSGSAVERLPSRPTAPSWRRPEHHRPPSRRVTSAGDVVSFLTWGAQPLGAERKTKLPRGGSSG